MCGKSVVSLCLILFSLSLKVVAQEQFPSRLLRASLIQGDVNYLRSDLDKWVDLSINTPILEGDKIWVGRNGRAEMEFEDGSTVRLAQNSVIEFTRLGPYDATRQVEIQLNKGLATFDVISGEGDFSIATPLFSARVASSANLRVEVDSDDSGRVVVFEGRTEIESQAGNFFLNKGETVSFLSSDQGRYYLGTNYEPDDWDRWNSERDELLVRARGNPPHLSYDSGWNTAELDQYGSWFSVPTFGTIWRPHCDASWAPFRTGRWDWYDPFGWTWISYEPWGWLPYHYGRWAHVGNHGWCWVPGSTFNRWCPGAVNWIQGASWVGWVPLAPSEPWYPHGFNSGRAFVSRNFRHSDSVSYLPNEAFLNGTSGGNFSRPREPLLTGRVVAGQPSLQPTRASRIPVPNAYAGRKFTNEDLEARREVRDRIIRSTVPAGSLNQAPGTVSSRSLNPGNRVIDHPASSSDSGIRVINGASSAPRQAIQATEENGVRSDNNRIVERDALQRGQSRQIVQPQQPGVRSSDPQEPRTQLPAAGPQSNPVSSSTQPEGQSRQRVYQIYGSRTEGSIPDRYSSSQSRESVSPRSNTSVPGTSSVRTSPANPSVPPARLQPAYNPPPVQRSMPSAPASVSSPPASGENSSRGQSRGASSNSSNQEGRSAAQGRANR